MPLRSSPWLTCAAPCAIGGTWSCAAAAEQVLPELAREEGWAALHLHTLVGTEEEAVEEAVRAALPEACAFRTWWDRTLVDPEELPFSVREVPEVFTKFRRKVERGGSYPEPLPAPASLASGAAAAFDPGDLPTPDELGCADLVNDERAVLRFRGGATAAAERIDAYVWSGIDSRPTRRRATAWWRTTRRSSPWLALGCVPLARSRPRSSATSASASATTPPTG